MPLRFAPLALLLASPALAQDAASPPPPPMAVPLPPAPPGTVRVTLQTAEGPILLELDKEKAPVTTANFLRYVDGHRLDGASFYRAVKVGDGYGLVQGGLSNDPRRLLPPIAHEPTSRTGLHHVAGTISMARAAPGTATADFFIVVGDLVSLDADPAKPGDNAGFAAFGHVVSGMDIVTHMLGEPTSPTAGPAAMKGQMLVAPVKILSAKRAG